jgi:hypothetical protein
VFAVWSSCRITASAEIIRALYPKSPQHVYNLQPKFYNHGCLPKQKMRRRIRLCLDEPPCNF